MKTRHGLLAVALVLAIASNANALEKVAYYDTEDGSGWEAGGSCSIVYYNRCTGWSWGWSGWGDGDRFGVCARSCCFPDGNVVISTQLRVFTASPLGYGFTGTVELHGVDSNCCPDELVATKPWLPTGPFDAHSWFNYVPAEFAVVYTIVGTGNPAGVGTDHPAAGPTGPQACGFCYPANRTNHSYIWGSFGAANCPGSTFHDGTCTAELRLDIVAGCAVSVADEGWGSIKALYR